MHAVVVGQMGTRRPATPGPTIPTPSPPSDSGPSRHLESASVLCKSKTQCAKPTGSANQRNAPFPGNYSVIIHIRRISFVMFHIFVTVDGLLIVALSLYTERLFILRFLGLNCYLFCLVPVRYELVISTEHIYLGTMAYCLQ